MAVSTGDGDVDTAAACAEPIERALAWPPEAALLRACGTLVELLATATLGFAPPANLPLLLLPVCTNSESRPEDFTGCNGRALLVGLLLRRSAAAGLGVPVTPVLVLLNALLLLADAALALRLRREPEKGSSPEPDAEAEEGR